MMASRFGEELVGHHTFVIASDGDMQEGVAAEASSLAGHWGLGRLITFYDANSIQLASPVDLVMSEDVGERYDAYGWDVTRVSDPNDVDEIEQATRDAMAVEDKPSLIIYPSHIGYGSPNKQDSSKAHGNPLGDDEVRLTKEAYGWDPDKQFYIPDEALEHFRECCAKGKQLEDEWRQKYDSWKSENGAEATLFDAIQAGTMPEGFDDDLPVFEADEKGMATRAASGKVLNHFAKKVPHLVGGSADLASSNNTDLDDMKDVLKGQWDGRNIHFGVREHGMGAICNGLCLQGFRAYGGTFLNFSDYMRGAVRIAALMKAPVIYVWTHDSIGLGEDGPTHQPVEHAAALRAMPRLKFIRPGDANETAKAWRFALRETEAPTALALTRQGVATLDPDTVPDDAIERGAYVVRDSGNGDPDVILIGTGSELGLARQAADELSDNGVDVRVVSMPCMENFDEQDDAYKDSVLPPAVRARVAVEAASPFGWDRWIGPDGGFVGMHTFGESGPANEVYAHFGITAERVVELARESMDRTGARSGG
jgi:transketolase